MQYPGGKKRQSRVFCPVLDEALAAGTGLFIEPFVGGFNIVPRLTKAKRVWCGDSHRGLINMYWALQDGWVPPHPITKEWYMKIRAEKNWDLPITAFAAFSCSFMSAEFGGYWDHSKKTHDALMKQIHLIKVAQFECTSYLDIGPELVPKGSVVYADPPYINVTKIYKNARNFDRGPFEDWCEQVAAGGSAVFTSEFFRPDRPGWEVVASVTQAIAVNGNVKSNRRQEEFLIRVNPSM